MEFREFLSSQTKQHASDSFVVKKGSIIYEPTAYYESLRKENPLILMKHLDGFPDFALVTNMFGSRSRVARAIGVPQRDLPKFWRKVIGGTARPTFASDGPVKEVCLLGDAVDLRKIPAPIHYSHDGGRYITAGLVAARDPREPSTINLTYSRIQILGRDSLALNAGSRGHFWSYLQSNRKKHRKTRVSIIIGASPLLYLVAAARVDDEYSKAATAGSLRLVRGLTNDIPVPAEAEIVVEAEISPHLEYGEGPFTEYTGYVSDSSTRNYGRVRGIMRRTKPIFLDITPSNSAEHVLLSSMSSEITLGGVLDRLPPSREYEVRLPLSGTLYLAFASVSTCESDLAKQLGLLLLGNDYYLKLAMVNEGGSLDGMFSYLANAAARGRNSPKKDIEVVDGVFCNRLDPSLSPGGRASKAIWTTRGDGEYTLNAGEGWAELATGGRGVFIGRKRSPRHQISVLLDPDINPSDEDEVTWAVMTRAQPAADFHFKGGNITIDARKPGIAERRASLPPEVVASVRRKVSASLRPS